jgi:hypothetical protein
MMRFKKILIAINLLFVMLSGCKNDDFTPLRNLENNYVVYCVLDNRSDKQFVELQRAFYPGMNKKLPGNTTVTLTEMPNSIYILKDTNIASREDYNVFYFDKFNLKRGSNYRLDVKNDLFSFQYSEIAIPKKYDILYNSKIEITLNTGKIHYNLLFRFKNDTPSVCFYRMYIEFETNTGFYKKVIEGGDYKSGQITYSYLSLEAALASLGILFYSAKVKRGYLIISQMTPDLYKYYLIENKQNDPYSVGLENQNWTNMKTTNNNVGLGIFGAICEDTINFKIPKELLQKFYFIDAQEY